MFSLQIWMAARSILCNQANYSFVFFILASLYIYIYLFIFFNLAFLLLLVSSQFWDDLFPVMLKQKKNKRPGPYVSDAMTSVAWWRRRRGGAIKTCFSPIRQTPFCPILSCSSAECISVPTADKKKTRNCRRQPTNSSLLQLSHERKTNLIVCPTSRTSKLLVSVVKPHR